jgi:hypothetical protein
LNCEYDKLRLSRTATHKGARLKTCIVWLAIATTLGFCFQNCAPSTTFDQGASTVAPTPEPGTQSSAPAVAVTKTTIWKAESPIGPLASGQHFGIEKREYDEMVVRPEPTLGQPCDPHAPVGNRYVGMWDDVSNCSTSDTSCASYSTGTVCCKQILTYSCSAD